VDQQGNVVPDASTEVLDCFNEVGIYLAVLPGGVPVPTAAVVQLPVDEAAVMIRLVAVTVPVEAVVPIARTQRPVVSEALVSLLTVVFEIDVELVSFTVV